MGPFRRTRRAQTVPAGELQAIVAFLRHLRRIAATRNHVTNVTIHTDSKYVHDHWLKGTSDTMANTRLWREFWDVIANPQVSTTLKKVASHKTLKDVESGAVDLRGYIGSDLADQGAKEAAS